MPEIWENSFANAILKIERANKHIADIEQRLLTSSDRYGPTMHINMNTGKQSLDYFFTDNSLRRDIALIVGDAVHNLHSALDIAWCGAVKNLSPGAYRSHTKFPIYAEDTGEQLETTLIGRKIAPTLIDLAVNRVKCHKGGDADILALRKFDIDDKHELLIPMLTVVGINGVEVQEEDGTIEKLDITLARPNSYRRQFSVESKLKNHGEVRFKITFREGTPLEGSEVIPTLKRFSWKTSRIVRALQRMK